MQRCCLLSEHRTASPLISMSHTNNHEQSFLHLKTYRTLTPTLNLFLCSSKIHKNLSSVREASVLSDIISSYFVGMQRKAAFCMCRPLMCKQGLGHNFTKKQKIYIKKRRKNMQCFFCQQDMFVKGYFVEGDLFVTLTKARENVFQIKICME